MYKYFLSFSYLANSGIRYGNTVLEMNICITDYDDANRMNKWIRDVQQHIENIANVKEVIILNYQLVK